MRYLENGTAAMFDYLIHDGRKTIELEELSTLIPQAWSINRKYVYALNSIERNNVVYEAENLAYDSLLLYTWSSCSPKTTNIKLWDSGI